MVEISKSNKKSMWRMLCFCLGAPFLFVPVLYAQDTSAVVNTYIVAAKKGDTGVQKKDTLAVIPVNAQPVAADSSMQDNKPEVDKRWYLSPLAKFQVQDFGLLEKNRLKDASDANTLPLTRKTNRSFALSLYKNFSGRFSASVDVGLSFGHITNDEVLVSQTRGKTYNLVNLSLYYHLLGPRFKLQPYLFAGANSSIKETAYTSIPAGAGLKYQSRGIMLMAQAAYGFAASKDISNTLMYSFGVYIPVWGKKIKPKHQSPSSPAKTTGAAGASNQHPMVSNIIIIVPPAYDSTLAAMVRNNAKGENGNGYGNKNSNGRNGYSNGGNAGDTTYSEGYASDGSGGEGGDKTVSPAVIKHLIYFNYDGFTLTTSAFAVLDQVVYQLKQNPRLFADLIGYTDLVGSDEYNDVLSRKRAQVAFEYLKSRGVSTDRLFFNYYGKKNPVVNSNSPNAAWQNRRTEIVLYEKIK